MEVGLRMVGLRCRRWWDLRRRRQGVGVDGGGGGGNSGVGGGGEADGAGGATPMEEACFLEQAPYVHLRH